MQVSPSIFMLCLQFTGVMPVWNDQTSLFECHLCSFTSRYKRSINRHIEIQHGAPQKIKCPMCPKAFSRKDHLKTHLKKIHQVDPSVLDLQWICILWTQVFSFTFGTIIYSVVCSHLLLCSCKYHIFYSIHFISCMIKGIVLVIFSQDICCTRMIYEYL